MRISVALLFVGLAVAGPTGARSGQSGMQAMRYYVGTWNCVGGAAGKPATNGTIAFTMDADGNALRDSIGVAAQGKLSRAWLSVETKYDASKQVFVDTAFDDGGWDVSYAKPWTGSTEEWLDHSTATGKLGHDRVVRIDGNSYTRTGYSTPTGTTELYKIKCTRAR